MAFYLYFTGYMCQHHLFVCLFFHVGYIICLFTLLGKIQGDVIPLLTSNGITSLLLNSRNVFRMPASQRMAGFYCGRYVGRYVMESNVGRYVVECGDFTPEWVARSGKGPGVARIVMCPELWASVLLYNGVLLSTFLYIVSFRFLGVVKSHIS